MVEQEAENTEKEMQILENQKVAVEKAKQD